MDAVVRLEACCRAVLAGERSLITQLQAAGFDCRPGYWAFSLEQLHAWLAPQQPFRDWRQQLYASDLNLRLRACGGQIGIAENHGKLALNRYCLQLLPPDRKSCRD